MDKGNQQDIARFAHDTRYELNESTLPEKRTGKSFLKRKRIGRSVSILLSLSLLLPFASFSEERVYGISDYGPVSVNGNGVGRGNDPTYRYIEDILYENGKTATGGNASPAANNGNGNASPSATQTPALLRNLAQLSNTSATKNLSTEIDAAYAVVFDLDNGSILGEKNASQVMNPASMTKVMTLLLCAEKLPDKNKKLTITQDIVSYIQQRGASNCGFVILPSGADAVLALCKEVAGSEAAFAELMNKRAKEMGLSNQCHFQNATGLYHSTHHMTVKDMGQIMAVAMQNPTAREVLMTENYQISPTNKHAQGLKFTNLFLQRIKTLDSGGADVQMAKTGYVSQSKFCVVSSGKGKNGKNLLVVTGGSSGTWQAVRDQAALYKLFGS